MKKVQVKELICLLESALQDKTKRKEYLRRFEEIVGECEIVDGTEEQIIALEDLAYDCAFYSNNPNIKIEDPSLFGDEELEKRIRETLAL